MRDGQVRCEGRCVRGMAVCEAGVRRGGVGGGRDRRRGGRGGGGVGGTAAGQGEQEEVT